MHRLIQSGALAILAGGIFCAPQAMAEARLVTNAVEAVNWTSGVSYTYDGAGNVRKIGGDTFVYDHAGRIVEANVNDVQRNYEYDAFGNRTKCLQDAGTATQGDCQHGWTINRTDNRVTGVSYDAAGNLKSFANHAYSYDDSNMVTRDDFGTSGLAKEFIYTADDERIATYKAGSSWHWTVRDVSGKVLRELTSVDGPEGVGTKSWTWAKDYVWRDGQLLASRHMAGAIPITYHYHLDHLGSARRVTDQNDLIVGVHDYMAFGPEVSGGQKEPAATTLKYTGHERDTWGSESVDTLDYMHARYYSPEMGRFLSVDPGRDWDPRTPQSWNMYSYVRNSPVIHTDPTGRQAIPGAMFGKCKLLCDDRVEQSAEGRAHETITVTAKDPGWLAALEYRTALKWTLGRMGRDFTGAEQAALMGNNHLATFLMLGGQQPPPILGSPVMIGPLGVPRNAWWASAAYETRVTRWMSEAEYAAMRRSGNLQIGAGGRTYVGNVGNQNTGNWGTVRVDFNVPSGALTPTANPNCIRFLKPTAHQ